MLLRLSPETEEMLNEIVECERQRGKTYYTTFDAIRFALEHKLMSWAEVQASIDKMTPADPSCQDGLFDGLYDENVGREGDES